MCVSSSLWPWTPFSIAFLAFEAFALASAVGGAGASFLSFGAIVVKSYLLFLFLNKVLLEPTDNNAGKQDLKRPLPCVTFILCPFCSPP